ncbi:MAG: M20/M25/M40 family metallo-hydrolase [Chloroflexota bacterium]|nr:M20/M25/M40 family metallo-hydrolase [Chloroflexota bacterium]
MKTFTRLIPRLVDLAIAIQQIPAPTFQERQRAEYIQQRFIEEALQDVHIDQIGNVFARLPGAGQKSPLVITAHSDTVFPTPTDLQVNREADKVHGPGIGDNSLGVAGMFGALWALQESITEGTEPVLLPGDIWFVSNVGEEGLGNLRGMYAVIERFGSDVLAYLVLEGMALGQVYHRALGVRRYRITVRTQGGHSWVDYGRPSAIHELASLTNKITAIRLPKQPRTTTNIGVIHGGTSINTIASNAYLELDLRSEGDAELSRLTDQVQRLVKAGNRSDVNITSELIGERPAGFIPADHPLIRLAARSLIEQGIQPVLSVGSTDANVPLSLGLPAVCLGLTTGSGAHTLEEYISIPPLSKGLASLVSLIESAFREL